MIFDGWCQYLILSLMPIRPRLRYNVIKVHIIMHKKRSLVEGTSEGEMLDPSQESPRELNRLPHQSEGNECCIEESDPEGNSENNSPENGENHAEADRMQRFYFRPLDDIILLQQGEVLSDHYNCTVFTHLVH